MAITETLKNMTENARINSSRSTLVDLINNYLQSVELLNKVDKAFNSRIELNNRLTSSLSGDEITKIRNGLEKLKDIESEIIDNYASLDITRHEYIEELSKIKDFYSPNQNPDYVYLSKKEREFVEHEFVKLIDKLDDTKKVHDERFEEGVDYIRETNPMKKQKIFAVNAFKLMDDENLEKRWKMLDEFRDKVQIAGVQKLCNKDTKDAARMKEVLKEMSDELKAIRTSTSLEGYKNKKNKRPATKAIHIQQAPDQVLENRLKSYMGRAEQMCEEGGMSAPRTGTDPYKHYRNEVFEVFGGIYVIEKIMKNFKEDTFRNLLDDIMRTSWFDKIWRGRNIKEIKQNFMEDFCHYLGYRDEDDNKRLHLYPDIKEKYVMEVQTGHDYNIEDDEEGWIGHTFHG